MKKLLSFILAAVMLLSFVSASAFAEEYKLGDVTKDGKRNISDATMMMKSIAGWRLNDAEFVEANGDFNGDGRLNLNDVRQFLQWLVSWDVLN